LPQKIFAKLKQPFLSQQWLSFTVGPSKSNTEPKFIRCNKFYFKITVRRQTEN
ncbi:MAG: hypothetical protein ACI9YH_004603, partial [Colwellia sp.]